MAYITVGKCMTILKNSGIMNFFPASKGGIGGSLKIEHVGSTYPFNSGAFLRSQVDITQVDPFY